MVPSVLTRDRLSIARRLMGAPELTRRRRDEFRDAPAVDDTRAEHVLVYIAERDHSSSSPSGFSGLTARCNDVRALPPP
jgi:hypothetical protein